MIHSVMGSPAVFWLPVTFLYPPPPPPLCNATLGLWKALYKCNLLLLLLHSIFGRVFLATVWYFGTGYSAMQKAKIQNYIFNSIVFQLSGEINFSSCLNSCLQAQNKDERTLNTICAVIQCIPYCIMYLHIYSLISLVVSLHSSVCTSIRIYCRSR